MLAKVPQETFSSRLWLLNLLSQSSGGAMLKVGWKRCPFCCRDNIHISHPKRLWEEVAILVLLQPVRCHDCMRRFIRPLFASPPPKMVVRRAATKELTPKEASDTVKRQAA